MARRLGQWLAQKVSRADLIAEDTVIVPVPLHPFRLLRRKYNQAALLAYWMGRDLGRPCFPNALVRLRYSPLQGTLSPTDRYDNVAHSMRLSPRFAGALRDRPVLLVDDVLTSGATMRAAVEALADVSTKINVAVLARASKND